MRLRWLPGLSSLCWGFEMEVSKIKPAAARRLRVYGITFRKMLIGVVRFDETLR